MANNAHLSLFSGIGGLDLAAEWAGFRTVEPVERDSFCRDVLAARFPGRPIHADTRTFKPSGSYMVVSGGFPCQPYSTSGRRLGAEDNRDLWPEYLRVVQECRPSWVVGENVVGIADMALDRVLTDLEAIGYASRAFDIPACAVGAPHERRRIFVVANATGERQQGQGNPGENAFDVSPPGEWQTSDAIDAIRRGSVPAMCREDHGIPARMDRLRALGNAVVPQQAFPIFKAIAEIEGINA
jgi:DNA (cytosine-5)-methyltransferase 1